MSGDSHGGGSGAGVGIAAGLAVLVVGLLVYNAGQRSVMAPSSWNHSNGNVGQNEQSGAGSGGAGRRPANTASGWKSCLAANNLLNVCKPDGGQVICKTAELAQQAGRLCGS